MVYLVGKLSSINFQAHVVGDEVLLESMRFSSTAVRLCRLALKPL